MAQEHQSEQPQQSDEEAGWLSSAVQEWAHQRIITQEQGQAILAYHQVTPRATLVRRVYGRLVTVLATLGAVLVGLGIILFIGSNWQEIPRFGKMGLILGAILAAYGAGSWLKYATAYPRVGGALLFMATIFYGAGVFLVAQVYHVNVNDPNLLYLWLIGVLPLAYLTRSRAMLSLAILVALGALGWKTAQWIEGTDNGLLFPALYLVVGAAGYALGLAHSAFARSRIYSGPYLALGAVTALVSLYLLTFEWLFQEVLGPYGSGRGEVPRGFLVVVGIAAGAGVAAGAVALVRQSRATEDWGTLPYEAAGVLGALLSAYLLVFLPFTETWPYVALYNVLLFIAILGAIWLGSVGKRGGLVNIGIALFALDAMTRYFDLLGGMLDTSLLFIGAGALLLGGGFALERIRRRLMAQLRLVEVSDEQ